MGCRCERKDPPDFDFAQVWQAYGRLIAFTLMPPIPRALRLGFKLAAHLRFRDPVFRAIAGKTSLHPCDLFRALDLRDQLIGSLEKFLEPYDGWLCPPAAILAPPHRKRKVPGRSFDVSGHPTSELMANGAFTLPFDLTGHPAVVFPIAMSGNLPVGAQLVGRLWRDEELLAAAEALAAASGPFAPLVL
jgi:amidase